MGELPAFRGRRTKGPRAYFNTRIKGDLYERVALYAGENQLTITAAIDRLILRGLDVPTLTPATVEIVDAVRAGVRAEMRWCFRRLGGPE